MRLVSSIEKSLFYLFFHLFGKHAHP
jgi:hypothetical protein